MGKRRGESSSRTRSRESRSGEPEAKHRRHASSAASGSTSKSSSRTHAEPRCEEIERLKSHKRWLEWGPYLSERQWGTLREDYSKDGNCWKYFSYTDATARAYRWGEDGLMGICDEEARFCMSLALWNGKDRILKERLFGLIQSEGNHGEDVKECYYYLDSTPTHSYMKALYKYPQNEFPYEKIVEENGESKRGLKDQEFELEDTGIFDDNCYWDVYVEYAKVTPQQIVCRITVHNRGPNTSTIHVLPNLWFRNTWSWGSEEEESSPKIQFSGDATVDVEHPALGNFCVHFDNDPDGNKPDLLFTDNNTNMEKIFDLKDSKPFTKDAFHKYVIEGDKDAVNPDKLGSKCAAHYVLELESGESSTVQYIVSKASDSEKMLNKFGSEFEKIFKERIKDADLYYSKVLSSKLTDEERNIARQACAGLLWTKQFFYYHVKEWMYGLTEESNNKTLSEPRTVTNKDWKHMLNHDIISMPDKWEFPWYAVWDLAFHMLPFSQVDQEFAKNQLLLFLSDRYIHPNGQLPAYEFDFSDVNPPVHAWACIQVYNSAPDGHKDLSFLKKCFNKLLLNFTWWVNKKDTECNHVYSGGFLGMDNISAIHRSESVPGGGNLAQADGTGWMAFYSSCMLRIALELARHDSSYTDMVIKFLHHFSNIAKAMNNSENGLWDKEDGFYYDCIKQTGGLQVLKIRSLVGLVSLFSCQVIDESDIKDLEGVEECLKSLDTHNVTHKVKKGRNKQTLLSVPDKSQLQQILSYLSQEEEFLSSYGIRSLSKIHTEEPFSITLADGKEYSISYAPGESNTDMFGGNSNWRGPIWICMNYLLIEALERYGEFYGDDLTVEFPAGSGTSLSLDKVAEEVSKRIVKIFLPDKNGRRPVHGDASRYANDTNWSDLVLFNEYFHSDTGRGCGASHQTGWTALVLCLLQKLAQKR